MTSQSLAGVKRDATVDHVTTATRRFVIAHGLDCTMDELAEAAGVSRRTLFRLFASREKLIAEAFAAGMNAYALEQPAFEGDCDRWLRATCDVTHKMNTAVGPGFWELTSRSDLPPDLSAIERTRRRRRQASTRHVATVLWVASGGQDEPPGELVAIINAHLSPHFTAAVVTDAGRGWQLASELAYAAISTALTTFASSEAVEKEKDPMSQKQHS